MDPATHVQTMFVQRMLRSSVENWLNPREITDRWAHAAHTAPGTALFGRFLEEMGVEWSCPAPDLARIPRTGPVVVVANHPFGLAEGPVLGALLTQIRPDVKFLANSLLAGLPGLDPCLIPVNPFGNAAQSNGRALRHSIEWLRRGGLLVTFPSGEVASLQLPQWQIAEPQWNQNIARIIRITGARAVPIFFHGANGAGFHIAGLIDPRLRTALLPRELLNKRGQTIHVAIGRPVSTEMLLRMKTDREAMDYLHQRTVLLRARSKKPVRFAWAPMQARIAGPVEPHALRREAEALPPGAILLESGDYRVCVAPAAHIPDTLREIGRLREIAFRSAGEGTGRSLDLDRFDKHYQHLWVSHRETGEVAGAYRLIGTDKAGTDTAADPQQLYTSTLFRFRPGLLGKLHPALELGRSFVRPERQKSYQALLLLWKGIGRYVARHPRYKTLFGPVSISRDYSAASRSLMVSYLESSCPRRELADSVAPRRQFRGTGPHGADASLLAPLLKNLEELSEAVADMEADGKGVPVLLRQYLQLGGAVVAFNVDRAFSNVVDGLVVVDLTRLAPAHLEKYLGRDGAAAFRAYHEENTQKT